jgi:hypothetical protein
MPVKVDLGVTIIPNNHRVWKLFPGEGYKFLDSMLENNAVFLDVRGLVDLGENPIEWDDEELLELISTDRWERQNELRIEQTDRRISAADKRTATLINGLFCRARKGDMVIMPHPGNTGSVSIGRFTTKKNSFRSLDAVDGRIAFEYPTRPVKWLARVNKRQLPYDLIELLQTPVAFFDLGNSGRELFYTAAFDNYLYDGVQQANYHTTKDIFTSRDNRTVSTWMEFVEVVSSAENFADIVQQPSVVSISDLIDQAVVAELDRSDLAININSPGSLLSRAVTMSPLIGLAMYPLAVQQTSFAQATNATFVASTIGGADDECVAQLGDDVRNIIEALGADKWQRACQLAVRADSEANLKTKSRIVEN